MKTTNPITAKVRDWVARQDRPFTSAQCRDEVGGHILYVRTALDRMMREGLLAKGDRLPEKRKLVRGERLWVRVVSAPSPSPKRSAPATSGRSISASQA